MKDNQSNSFLCKICGEVFTEESGSYKGFTCESCQDKIDRKKEELILQAKRHLRGLDKVIEKLEKE